MKNIGMCLGLIAFLTLSSCEKKVEKTTEIETVTTETDTVVVKDTVHAEGDGTSVKVDSNGVEVEVKK